MLLLLLRLLPCYLSIFMMFGCVLLCFFFSWTTPLKVIFWKVQKMFNSPSCFIKLSHILALQKIYTCVEVLRDAPLLDSPRQTSGHIQESVTKAIWQPVFIVRMILHLPEPNILELNFNL